jgi:hypothetical protein
MVQSGLALADVQVVHEADYDNDIFDYTRLCIDELFGPNVVVKMNDPAGGAPITLSTNLTNGSVVTLPSYLNCLDGTELRMYTDDNGTRVEVNDLRTYEAMSLGHFSKQGSCTEASWLDGRCNIYNFGQTFLKATSSAPVDMFLMCRKYNDSVSFTGDQDYEVSTSYGRSSPPPDGSVDSQPWLTKAQRHASFYNSKIKSNFNYLTQFDDVAMVWRNKATGKACFFQAALIYGQGIPLPYVKTVLMDETKLPPPLPSEVSGDNPVKPSVWQRDGSVWVKPTTMVQVAKCYACHGNDPFMHSPWIDQAPGLVPTIVGNQNKPIGYIGGPSVNNWVSQSAPESTHVSVKTDSVPKPEKISVPIPANPNLPAVQPNLRMDVILSPSLVTQVCTSCHRINANNAQWIDRATGIYDKSLAHTNWNFSFPQKYWMPPGGVMSQDDWDVNLEYSARATRYCVTNIKKNRTSAPLGCRYQDIGFRVGPNNTWYLNGSATGQTLPAGQSPALPSTIVATGGADVTMGLGPVDTCIPPRISSLAPAKFLNIGGGTLRINGKYFTNNLEVYIHRIDDPTLGGESARCTKMPPPGGTVTNPFKLNFGGTQFSCVVPPMAPGTYSVTVRANGLRARGSSGSSSSSPSIYNVDDALMPNSLTIEAPAISVTSISPNFGSFDKTTTVIIKGAGFVKATVQGLIQVPNVFLGTSYGSVNCTPVAVSNVIASLGTTLTCKVPPSTFGCAKADVRVTNPGMYGNTATLANGFEYRCPSSSSSFSSSSPAATSSSSSTSASSTSTSSSNLSSTQQSSTGF